MYDHRNKNLMLSHSDRVRSALEHVQPDRVPLDLGGTQTGILGEPYDALKRALNIPTPTTIGNIVMGLARVEEEVLRHFDIDFRHVLPGTPQSYTFTLFSDDSFYDEWGTRWKRPRGGYYYDMVEYPFKAFSLREVESFCWPDPDDPGRIMGVEEELKNYREHTDYALEAGLIGIWETSWFLVGLYDWLKNIKTNLEFVEAVLDKVLIILKRMHGAYLETAGPYLDIVTLWDDYGAQGGLQISPTLWRKLVKPRLAELINVLRSKTSAAIAIHSCGSLSSILTDMVDIGIQVINPVQVSARGMDPQSLKKQFGKHLTFWGGIDTQALLPFGSPSDIRETVRKTVSILGSGGGYILAAVHNIQPGVPPENILEMYNACRN
jgi:uroporphyrinogen decarboxylase